MPTEINHLRFLPVEALGSGFPEPVAPHMSSPPSEVAAYIYAVKIKSVPWLSIIIIVIQVLSTTESSRMRYRFSQRLRRVRLINEP